MNSNSEFDQVINKFWDLCRLALPNQVTWSKLPDDLSRLIRRYAEQEISQNDVSIVKTAGFDKPEGKEEKYVAEILKLFDASGNGYRSITNVLYEYLKLQKDLNGGVYDLNVGNYALVDGISVQKHAEMINLKRCPVCNRFNQTSTTFALISGGPQADSGYQTYRNKQGKRSSIHVCQYCFISGWVDLPTAKIIKDGQNVSKGREYLFITTPLSRQGLEELLKLIARAGELSDLNVDNGQVDDDRNELDDNQQAGIEAFLQVLHTSYGIELSEPLSVLGFHTRRLRELRGFVLQSSNHLQRTLVLRVPFERLVGDDKVSGAVRRELVKATMYDFWRITGGSLHYNRVRDDTPFSVDGQSISLNEMYRANRAYFIADRYARVGTYRQLNSGMFMLLLSHPRHAANRIFNAKKRESSGRYAPGSHKVKEIIDMVEEITQQDDWQFQLGLKIVELLVTVGLTPRAKGFWKNTKEPYSGVDLVKWIQRIKMAHDPNTTRAWGTSLMNGYRREHGYGANTETTEKIIGLVEEIIASCQQHDTPISEFARSVANMDYYLLFYYNQKQSQQNL